MERVKSSDVLDTTHQVKAPFQAVVVGAFRRVGPNVWDDYEFVRTASMLRDGSGRAPGVDDGGDVTAMVVHALTPVQLESRGCDVRLRTSGKVIRVRFQPSAEDQSTLTATLGESFDARTHARALRDYFVSRFLEAAQAAVGLGAAAVIVNKLND